MSLYTNKSATSAGGGAGVTDAGSPVTTLDGYFKLAGRAGGQVGNGDTASGGNLQFSSTANATKGNIWFGSATGFNYSETNKSIGIGIAPQSGYVFYMQKTSGDTIAGFETTSNSGSAELQMFAGARGGFLRTYGFSAAGTTQGQTNADVLHLASGGVEGIAMLVGGDFDFKVRTNSLLRLTVNSAGLTLPASHNIVLATSGGTKIGTATTQLLGFYNATPVDQPATVADPSGGAVQDAESRTAIIAVIDRLQELGLIA